jgi:carboxylesterase type B
LGSDQSVERADIPFPGWFDWGRDVTTNLMWVPILLFPMLLGCAGLAVADGAVPALPPACQTQQISTSGGALCGALEAPGVVADVEVFRGIPYADSVSGRFRWTDPRPLPAWQAVRAATTFGPACAQHDSGYRTQAEDCLFLNIWRPRGLDDSAKLPVMVFIHGGGFVSGASSDPLYNGARLARRGVIVVSLNYRLGALGFLALGELAGNYGLRDQQLAMQWIKRNVAAFGGDAQRITLFGESAGAISIGLHLASMPGSRPLFARAIMQSNLLGVPLRDLAASRTLGQAFAKTLHCSDADCLRQRPLQSLLAASQQFKNSAPMKFPGLAQVNVWAPAIDGELLAAGPMALADGIDKPFILGNNGAEGVLFLAPFAGHLNDAFYRKWLVFNFPGLQDGLLTYYPSSSADNSATAAQVFTDGIFSCAARAFAQRSGAPSWVFRFDEHTRLNLIGLPACQQLPCHTYELPYVFGSADLLTLADGSKGHLDADEARLSEQMQRYWVAFADKGVPAVEGQADWRPYRSQQQILSFAGGAARPLADGADACGPWQPLYGQH